MAKQAWTPWHEVVKLREDVRSGDLSLASFAADLYDVMMSRAKPIYRDPKEFFALTYPTYNLRHLAKDVVLRLAGKNDKAVRRLQLTYGGGKTHSLITLYHLAHQPESLPNLPAVKEFETTIGEKPPKAKVIALCFDKFDSEKGIETLSPDGSKRWLRNPWSWFAYQLAGDDGLKLISAKGGAEERETPPAEPLVLDLIKMGGKDGTPVLILIDEVLMYAHGKVAADPSWEARLVNFFQYMTQAATKLENCCIVASLLASDPEKMDEIGKRISKGISDIFGRQQEEGVVPVTKEDVAEVLRRRFFTPESIKDREPFRQHVVAAMKGIMDMDEQTRRQGSSEEERFVNSYPFHPELTEVFYTKWTNLESFQRTRGILRTFALGLRDTEKSNECPLVGLNVFLTDAGKEGISEALRELSGVAEREEYEGRRQDWTAILEGELGRARRIQNDTAGIKQREVEQAVIATFLHSQPIGKNAQTRDVLVLLGQTRPDRINLEKALVAWAKTSHWLDDQFTAMAVSKNEMPATWRLGNKPNLTQMHSEACQNVSPQLVETDLLDKIQGLRSLTIGASGAGVKVHNLPGKPKDVEDDGDFHYVILGPGAAAESGKPGKEATKFIEEKTGPDAPRVYRNAILVVSPWKDGLDVARARICEWLGWEEVQSNLPEDADAVRKATARMNADTAKGQIIDGIRRAYCIVVTVSDKNEVQAFKIAPGEDPLFTTIKDDPRSRIQETAVSADALLPGGPYNLWHEGEDSRRVKDLVGAFAQLPHLPKMLNRQAILDTLVDGCVKGTFVMKLTRPDRSIRTWWMSRPDEEALKEPSLEVVLPEKAELTEIPVSMAAPGTLPCLWKDEGIQFRAMGEYFSGGKVVQVQRDGYEEPLSIPKVARPIVEAVVQDAVRQGKLWLTAGPASILGEDVPAGILNDQALLQAPPPPIPAMEILPTTLPDAWREDKSNGMSIVVAYGSKKGQNLPWPVIRTAIEDAIRARMIQPTADSGPWPCALSGAQNAKFEAVTAAGGGGGTLPKPKPGVLTARATLRPNQVQDLADEIPDLTKATVGHDVSFQVTVQLGDGETKVPDVVIKSVAKLLKAISDEFNVQ